ncbi:MAG: MFS transporter [Chloroflexota bacterium]
MRMHPKISDIYYGWYIVAALAITETVSFGILYYAFTVFITPMQADMGWTLAQITGAFSLALLVSGVITLPVGSWLDERGARGMMTLASVGATALLIAWAFVDSLWLFYVIWVGLGVTMAMLFYDPAFVVVANWFVKYRSRALAIVTLMAGFASTIFLPLTDYLVIQFGWRNAVLILAGVQGIITIPLHGFILRRRPSDLGLRPDGSESTLTEPVPDSEKEKNDNAGEDHVVRDAIRSPIFIWISIGFGCSMLASIGLRVHFIPLLIDAGFNSSRAAWLAGIIGIMQVVGRLLFAPIENRLSSRDTTMLIMVLTTVSFVFLLMSTSETMVWAFVVLFGAAVGASTLARPVIVSDMYDVKHFGRINSVMAFLLTLVITASPIGAGILYEWSASYTPVLWVFLIFSGLSVIAIAQIPASKQKRTP